jgi:hypothetical protein
MAPHDWTTEGFGAGDLKDLNIIGNIPTVWKETVLLDFADSRKRVDHFAKTGSGRT